MLEEPGGPLKIVQFPPFRRHRPHTPHAASAPQTPGAAPRWFNRIDPILGTFAALAVSGSVLLVSGRGPVVVALLLVVSATGVAYADPRWPGWLVASGAVVAYVALAGLLGHLDRNEYWTHVLFLGSSTAAVLAAANAGRRRDEYRDDHALLVDLLDDRRVTERLDRLLAAERQLGEIERELLRAQRHDHATSVLIVRPDRLGEAELEQGREGVSAMLTSIAESIGLNVRSTDLGRSDPPKEFVLLLPETDAVGARVAAERIRLAMTRSAVEFVAGPANETTVSIGVASFPTDGHDQQALVDAARHALGRAIELGGNRTILATVPETAPPGWSAGRGRVEQPPRA